MVKIGKKIKNMRMTQELTQEELANRANLTKGFISMVERDLQSPALDTLESILNALDSTLAEFFAETKRPTVVFRHDERVRVEEEGGIVKEILIPAAQGREADPLLVTLPPGSATEPETPHYGDECGLVLAGRITINIGKEVYEAATGDAFYYTADRQHWLKNNANTTARIIWISAPPSF